MSGAMKNVYSIQLKKYSQQTTCTQGAWLHYNHGPQTRPQILVILL